jgi:hypothetical protein
VARALGERERETSLATRLLVVIPSKIESITVGNKTHAHNAYLKPDCRRHLSLGISGLEGTT